MKGDFSRITFDRSKHYTGVRLQQGRVQLDADWNEHADIGDYQRHTLAADLIGGSGAPAVGGGFAVTVNGAGELRLSAGRYYVDGILCENEKEIPLTDQPELPGFVLPPQEGRHLAYLDVWERSITALEDPDLLELALGGPDTATRTRTVWQVKLAKVDNNTSTLPADWLPDQRTLPTLIPRAVAGSPQQNQLYRIEVHEPAELDGAGNVVRHVTFKWSRDNASSVASIENPAGNSEENRFQIVIRRQVGPDQGGGFETGQWIEVTDEHRILRGEPGILAKLSSVDGQVLSVEGWPGASDPAPDLPIQNQPTLRRWDSDGATQGERMGDTTTLNLGGGVEVLITGKPGDFRTGDYWVVATRAAGGVQWPVNKSTGAPVPAPPQGIRHHYAPLALVDRGDTDWSLFNAPESVRKVFRGTAVIPGGEKLDRHENDRMTASLVIEGSLKVGVAGTSGDGLELLNGPLVLTQGGSGHGLRFAGLGSFLREESNKMTLGAVGSALALSQGGTEYLTITSSGQVGIRTASPQEDVHVVGKVILLDPGTSVQIKRSLVYTDSSKGEGKVLTSDKDGNATWRELPTRQLGAPVFVHRFEVASSPSTTVATGWIRFQLPSSIPTGIRAVILEAQAAKKDPNVGNIDGYIAIRRTLGASEDILLRARAAGSGDISAWSNQGLFPVDTDNSFEYAIQESGFDDGWIIRVIGYFP